jgi:capsular exopolysaccharide synthesis family protein
MIVRKSDDFPYLYYITTGTLPPNPSELLGSRTMNEFLLKMRSLFDVIIIDSAPLINVTDSEILSRQVDGTMLVTTANVTEMDMMEKAVGMLKHDGSSFIGVVLNKFAYTPGYGSYYKYYYYYSSGNGNRNGNGHADETDILKDIKEFKHNRN